MKSFARCLLAASTFVAIQIYWSPAQAGLGDALKDRVGGMSSSGTSSGGIGSGGIGSGMVSGGLGSGLTPSALSAGSTGNAAGILQYCIKNNYLGGGDATSVKDQLISRMGGKTSSDSGYADGERGILTGANGQKVDLSGAGLKSKVTRQVCDKVLDQAKSMM